MNKKLKIGLLIDDIKIPAWMFRLLELLVNDGGVNVSLIICNQTEKPIDKSFKHYFYRLYTKLDNQIFKTYPDAFEDKNINNVIDSDYLKLTPLIINDKLIIENGDIEIIRKYNLDIILRFGFENLKGEILNIPNYGVWSYFYSDIKINKSLPNGFWEIVNNEAEIGITLQVEKNEPEENLIIAKSFSGIDKLSVNRGLNWYFWKAASILPRHIKRLNKIGEKEFFENIYNTNTHPSFYFKSIKKIPSNTTVLKKVLKLNYLRFKNIFKHFFYKDQWILFYRINESKKLSTSFNEFSKLIPPKDRLWADPHVIRRDGNYYIFIEELIYSEGKGFISVIEMDNDGNYKAPVEVLKADYHLSFPFIIEDGGEMYMIPETEKNNRIELYKCIGFPFKWRFEKVLMNNIRAVDTVIVKKDKKYWMFTNLVITNGASLNDELHIFYSDKLVTDNWVSHPENPVVSDVKKARNAGRFFKHNNNLYRPSQNCSHHYGYGMQINHVVELNENNYKEVTVDQINPDWDTKIISTHSISHYDNLTVIDAEYKRRK